MTYVKENKVFVSRWDRCLDDSAYEESILLVEALSGMTVEGVQPENDEESVRSLEFGGGQTTLLLSGMGLSHTSIVHESSRAKMLKDNVGHARVNVIATPVTHGWYDWTPPYDSRFNLIVIGGPPQFAGVARCVDVVKEVLSPSGVIFVADTHYEARKSISRQLANVLGMRVNRKTQAGRSLDLLLEEGAPIGEGPGTELMRWLKTLPQMPPCQLCHNLARKMNEWGVDGCRKNREFIVEDMLSRARRWWNNSTVWMKAEAWFRGQGEITQRLHALKKTATGDIDGALRDSIRRHIDAAIDSAKGGERRTD